MFLLIHTAIEISHGKEMSGNNTTTLDVPEMGSRHSTTKFFFLVSSNKGVSR